MKSDALYGFLEFLAELQFQGQVVPHLDAAVSSTGYN